MSVPPVARAIMMLIADLDEAFLKVKNMDSVDKTREIDVPFDKTKAGFKFCFYEGLGFIEYGEFIQPSLF